jgi:hypothetical protein
MGGHGLMPSVHCDAANFFRTWKKFECLKKKRKSKKKSKKKRERKTHL